MVRVNEQAGKSLWGRLSSVNDSSRRLFRIRVRASSRRSVLAAGPV